MIELNEGIALRDAAATAARARLAADMSRADAALRPALRYLQSHLFDPQIEAAELARRGKLRGGRGSTRWRAVTGMTVGDYMRMLRVHTAAALLVDTSMANERIAELVGYQEITTFYRAFRRVLGTTPAAYRARQRGAAAQDNTEGQAPGRLAHGRLALATEAPEWLTAFDAWSRAEAASRDRASCDPASRDWGLPDSQVLAESATGRASLAWGVARGLSPQGREHLVAHAGPRRAAVRAQSGRRPRESRLGHRSSEARPARRSPAYEFAVDDQSHHRGPGPRPRLDWQCPPPGPRLHRRRSSLRAGASPGRRRA